MTIPLIKFHFQYLIVVIILPRHNDGNHQAFVSGEKGRKGKIQLFRLLKHLIVFIDYSNTHCNL